MIRTMEERDATQICDLGWKMANLENSSFKTANYSKEVLADQLKNVWTKNTNYYSLVAIDKNDKIYGSFVGYVNYHFHSSRVFASELFLYVDKEKRGGIAPFLMIKRFERWAKLKGAHQIRVGNKVGIDINIVKGFYERLNYNLVGYNFCKEI